MATTDPIVNVLGRATIFDKKKRFHKALKMFETRFTFTPPPPPPGNITRLTKGSSQVAGEELPHGVVEMLLLPLEYGGDHVVHQRKRKVHIRLKQQHHVSVTVETMWFTSGNGRSTYGCNNNTMCQSR